MKKRTQNRARFQYLYNVKPITIVIYILLKKITT